MIKKILENYPIDLISYRKFGYGLINETYKVKAKEGEFILQKLHDIYHYEVLKDTDAVSSYLESKKFPVQKIVKTNEGKLGYEIGDRLWRLNSYVEGKVFQEVVNESMAYEAGFLLGKFHRTLKDFNYEFKSRLPAPHNSPEIFKRFILSIPKAKSKEIDDLCKKIYVMPALFYENKLRKVITHGDPKISNLIFTKKRKALALIDLDGCCRNNIVVELADAFRSWSSKREDSEDNVFNISYFQSALRGYFEGSFNFLHDEELDLLSQTMSLIVLELASKFMRDYFLDQYFDWDPKRYKSRKEHNLARVRSQLNLYEDIVRKQKQINQVIDKV